MLKRIAAAAFFAYSILGLGVFAILGRSTAAYTGDINPAHLPALLILAAAVIVLIASTVCGLVLMLTVDRGYLAGPAILVVFAVAWWLSTSAYPMARFTGEAILGAHLVLVVFGTWNWGETDTSDKSLDEHECSSRVNFSGQDQLV